MLKLKLKLNSISSLATIENYKAVRQAETKKDYANM